MGRGVLGAETAPLSADAGGRSWLAEQFPRSFCLMSE